MRRPARALGVLLLALPAAACAREAESEAYAGTIELPDVAVGSLVGGRVERVLRREGEEVAAGDLLVELDADEWRTARDESAALAEATARELDLLLAGPRAEEVAQAEAEAERLRLLWQVSAQGARPEEVAGAREQVRAAQAEAAEAEREVERLRPLVRTSVEPAASLERASAARDAALARRRLAEQRLQLLERGLRPEEVEAARQGWRAQEERAKALRAGARPEEVAAKRAVLEAARARTRLAETRLAELRVVAPADAFVQTLDLRPGDLLRAGDAVAVLLVKGEPWITVYVPEEHLARVRLGQEAEVRPDGHPPLTGRVTWISRRAEFSPRNVQTRGERVTQVFAVRVTVAGDASLLKDGLWADVRLR